MDEKNIRDAARIALERQLQSAKEPWERLPILLALAKEPTRNDPDAGEEYAREALILAREWNDPFWIACSLQMIGIQLGRTSRYSEILENLTQASAIFAELNDSRRKAETDLLAANTCILTGRFVDAMQLLLASLRIFKELKAKFWVIHTLCSIADIYREIGNHGKGVKYYWRAIAVAVKSDLELELGTLYQHLGLAYRRMGDYRRAHKYQIKSLKIEQGNNNSGGIAVAMANIANVYIEQGLYIQAERYVRESGRLYHVLGYISHEAISWGRLASIYRYKGECAKALRCFRKGIALARKCEDKVTLGILYQKYGDLCIRMEDTMRGVAYIKKAVALINQSGNSFHQYQAYELLADAYEAIGDAEHALKYYKKSAHLKSSYINSQKLMEVSHAAMQEQIKGLTRQLKAEEQKTGNLTKIAEEKEAELLALTLRLIPDNGRNRTVNSSMERSQITASDNWEIFARQFHKTHYSFYNTLINAHPSLTPTEVKVSSLIRIGLSTKEIADILCISKRTVDTHRVRIHKKMRLPQGTSLSRFIAQM